jgi:hypothetical protein
MVPFNMQAVYIVCVAMVYVVRMQTCPLRLAVFIHHAGSGSLLAGHDALC